MLLSPNKGNVLLLVRRPIIEVILCFSAEARKGGKPERRARSLALKAPQLTSTMSIQQGTPSF